MLPKLLKALPPDRAAALTAVMKVGTESSSRLTRYSTLLPRCRYEVGDGLVKCRCISFAISWRLLPRELRSSGASPRTFWRYSHVIFGDILRTRQTFGVFVCWPNVLPRTRRQDASQGYVTDASPPLSCQDQADDINKTNKRPSNVFTHPGNRPKLTKLGAWPRKHRSSGR